MPRAKLYQYTDSKNRKCYRIDYKKVDGSHSTKRLGHVSKGFASKVEADIRKMVYEGKDPSRELQKTVNRLSDVWEQYLISLQGRNSQSTIDTKNLAYNNFIQFKGDISLSNIKTETIEGWQRYMLDNGLTPAGVSMRFRAVRAFLKWSFERNYVDHNPVALVKDVKQIESNPEQFFTVEEIKLILDDLHRDKTEQYKLVFLALETGGRLSELVFLKWTDIENGVVTFRGTETKKGKTRTVPLRKGSWEEVQTWEKTGDRIFAWQEKRSAGRVFRRTLLRLGLKEIEHGERTFHTLRHSYASHLLMNGVDIYTVSRLLGHSSVTVTEAHYAHLIMDRVKLASEKLPY